MSLTALLCALLTGVAVAYAVEEARRLRSGRLFRYVTRGQAVRRIVGSLLVALLMVLVYVGLEVVDAFGAPGRFLAVWTAASLLTVLLLLLGWLDLRELQANRDIESAREVLLTLQRKGREAGKSAESGER